MFIHGLGIGLFQYNVTITDLLEKFPDRPVLLPLQPHVSQGIFHPRFLQPMNRHETADRLAGLMFSLGWVNSQKSDSEDFNSEEDKAAVSLLGKAKKGVTMLSHSKLVHYSELERARIEESVLQRLVRACVDAERLSEHDHSLVLRGSGHVLLMGRRWVTCF